MERNNLMSIKFTETVDTRTVLIVEDDITLQEHWVSIFEELPLSFEIKWASSAEQFESEVRRKSHECEKYDFIISDIFLSGSKNGLDLWREYSSMSEYFILTSDISLRKYDEMLARDRGMRPMLLTKPLEKKRCVETIEYLLHYSKKNPGLRIEA